MGILKRRLDEGRSRAQLLNCRLAQHGMVHRLFTARRDAPDYYCPRVHGWWHFVPTEESGLRNFRCIGLSNSGCHCNIEQYSSTSDRPTKCLHPKSASDAGREDRMGKRKQQGDAGYCYGNGPLRDERHGRGPESFQMSKWRHIHNWSRGSKADLQPFKQRTPVGMKKDTRVNESVQVTTTATAGSRR